MRSSRLLTILLLLQARGQVTARQLASELEVSERTVYRDLDDLSASGVPVYGERGKGGGYRLLEGYRTELTGMSAEEAGTLLLAGAPGPAAELGLGSILATTRLKLLTAVPPGLRETAVRAEQRFYLDPAAWAHDRSRDDRYLQRVAGAVWHDRRLEIAYARSDGESVQRTIDPLGLVHKTGRWYLVAIADGAERVYRIDRLVAVHERVEPAMRPAGFDVTAFWGSWEAEYAATLPIFRARVVLGPEAMRHRDNLGPLAPREVLEQGVGADGWVAQTLEFDTPQVAVAALLALAPQVEVVEPQILRAELSKAAQAIVDRNQA